MSSSRSQLGSSKTTADADGKRESLSLLGIDFKLKQRQTSLQSRNLSLLLHSHDLLGENGAGPGSVISPGPVGWSLRADLWATGQQEPAACFCRTYFWEQDCDVLHSPGQKLGCVCICLCGELSTYTKSCRGAAGLGYQKAMQ